MRYEPRLPSSHSCPPMIRMPRPFVRIDVSFLSRWRRIRCGLEGGVRARNLELSSACRKMFSQVSMVFRRSLTDSPDADEGRGKPSVDEALFVCAIDVNSASELQP